MPQESPEAPTSDLHAIEGFALSPPQKHLLRLERAGSPDSTWLAECRVDIAGSLEIPALERGLATVIRRHEILRTSFHTSPETSTPMQVIHEPSAPVIDLHERVGLPGADRPACLHQLAVQLRSSPFHDGDPSVRFALVSFSKHEHTLLICQPAVCGDSDSLGILVHEIAAACGPDKEAVAGDEPLQYADLSQWLNEALDSEDDAASRDWWLSQDLPAVSGVHLPHQCGERGRDSFRRDCMEVGVPEPLQRILDDVHGGIPAPELLLATWAVLLGRLTDRTDLVVGVSTPGRVHEPLQGAPGLFRKLLPIPCGTGDDPVFADTATRIRTAMAEAAARHEFFDPRMLHGSPSLAFEYQPPVDDVVAGDLIFRVREQSCEFDRSGLELRCDFASGQLRTRFAYDASMLTRQGVESIAGQYHTLLGDALRKPSQPISQLNMMSDEERSRVLFEFNDTAREAPTGVCIHDLIESQAARTPHAHAVMFEDTEITYADLNARSNQLAHYLRKHGVGPDVFVGIHAEPSLEIVVAILAVLKAGGAYVPLDPDYPEERINFMLDDTKAPVVLTQRGLRQVRPSHPVHVFQLDAGWDCMATEPCTNPAPLARPGNLAYAIYTSGSTGKPKGVPVTHDNLVHSTSARVDYYGGKVGRYLLFSSFSFDSSVAGIFWTLIDGGALVLPAAGTHRDPQLMNELMARRKVTHTLCLASHWALILSEGDPAAFASLDTSIVSGEVFSDTLVKRHDELAPGSALFNEYGPTEGTVWSAVFDCHDPVAGNKIPMGRPIANTTIYLLDAQRNPVPIGVPGELYQGGRGVAVGYLNRPELTAERFVEDPFCAGGRLYRSGDLARYLPDGNIEFLGRIDDQVKLRGYRIELGEIEAVLGKNQTIREVAVLCREDEPGDRRLVAYLAFENGASLDVRALRERLAEELPDYMIPSAFVELPALPRTSIGKLQKDQLPAPGRDRRGDGVDFVPPRTPVEEAIARVWGEVLDLDQVGVHDTFFGLGGNSMLAIRIVHQLRDVLATEVPLRALFDSPTIAAMAEQIDNQKG